MPWGRSWEDELEKTMRLMAAVHGSNGGHGRSAGMHDDGMMHSRFRDSDCFAALVPCKAYASMHQWLFRQ